MRVILSAFALLLSAASQAMQAPEVEYGGYLSFETQEGVMQGPAAWARDRERREFIMDGASVVMIIRRDRNLMWNLFPDTKMYVEMSLDDPKQDDGDDLADYVIEQADNVGSETINGVATTRSKMVMRHPNGEKLGGFFWRTDDGILMKMDALAVEKDSKARIKLELSDLVVGTQDPTLFELPAGYSKMGGMGMLLGAALGDEDEDDVGDNNDEGDNDAPEEPVKKKRFGLKSALDLLKN